MEGFQPFDDREKAAVDALQGLLGQSDILSPAEANAVIVAITNLVLFSRVPLDDLAVPVVNIARDTMSAVNAAIDQLERSGRFTFGSARVPWRER
jgi:hypothetical protein